MMPWPGLMEPFSECFLLGLMASVCVSHLAGVGAVSFFVCHVLVWFLFDMFLLRAVEVILSKLCCVKSLSL